MIIYQNKVIEINMEIIKKLINGFTQYVKAENLQPDLKIHTLHTRQH